jgi:hypothetical protein
LSLSKLPFDMPAQADAPTAPPGRVGQGPRHRHRKLLPVPGTDKAGRRRRGQPAGEGVIQASGREGRLLPLHAPSAPKRAHASPRPSPAVARKGLNRRFCTNLPPIVGEWPPFPDGTGGRSSPGTEIADAIGASGSSREGRAEGWARLLAVRSALALTQPPAWGHPPRVEGGSASGPAPGPAKARASDDHAGAERMAAAPPQNFGRPSARWPGARDGGLAARPRVRASPAGGAASGSAGRETPGPPSAARRP